MHLLILSLCAAYAFADVSHILQKKDESQAQIRQYEMDISPKGGYRWSFETDNGIVAGAQSEVVNPGDENQGQITQGQSSYTSPEGEKIELIYVADENGFQPQGSHIPTPPPIPEAILRSLEYIRTHPPKPETK